MTRLLIWPPSHGVQIRATARQKGMLCTRELAAVAQMVEHVIRNDGVGGSSPFSGTTNLAGMIDFVSIILPRGVVLTPEQSLAVISSLRLFKA